MYLEEKTKTILQIVVGIICGIILLVGLFIFLRPIRADFTRKTDIINFLNKKKINNIDKNTVNEYKYLLKLSKEPEKWDISPILYDYILKIDKAARYVMVNGNSDKNRGELIVRTKGLNQNEDSKIIYEYLGEDCTFLTTKECIKFSSLREEFFINNEYIYTIINTLEKIFIHDSEYPDEGWYITEDIAKKYSKQINNNQYIIELPYNCFLNFSTTAIEELDRAYYDVKINQNNKSLQDIEIELFYKDNATGENKTVKSFLSFMNKEWLHKKDMTIELYNTIFKFRKANIGIFSDLQIEE